MNHEITTLKNLRKNDLLSVKDNNNNGPKLSKITIISGNEVYEAFVVKHSPYQGMVACSTFVFSQEAARQKTIFAKHFE